MSSHKKIKKETKVTERQVSKNHGNVEPNLPPKKGAWPVWSPVRRD